MASRQFRNQVFGLEAMPVKLFCKFAVGATGAPTLVAAQSKGVKSIARNSTGDYTVTLGDSFFALLDADVLIQNATGIPAGVSMGLKTAGTNVNTAGAGTIELVFSTGGTATELASGDSVFLAFTLSNSNL